MSIDKIRNVQRKVNYVGGVFVDVQFEEDTLAILEDWFKDPNHFVNAFIVDREWTNGYLYTIWGFQFIDTKNVPVFGSNGQQLFRRNEYIHYKRGEDFDIDKAVYIGYMNMLSNIQR